MSNNRADLWSDLFNLYMFHLMTYFAAVMCETNISPISPLPVHLVMTFHQYRHDMRSYWRSIVTTALSCIISKIKRDISGKSQLSHTPYAFDDPVNRLPFGYCHKVWYDKTRMVRLPDGEKSFITRLASLIQHRCVTDRRTYTETSCDSTICAMRTHRLSWKRNTK